jgi:serine/threonine-protein kinase SRPK3
MEDIESSLECSSAEYTSEYTSESYDELSETNNIDLTNDIISNYNIIRLLGKGSYSKVWLAYNVNDAKFYALKVQNHNDYEEGVEEIKIIKKIPDDDPYINKLKECFIETKTVDAQNGEKRKYICSAYNLCSGNLDALARKGKYKNGYPEEIVKIMFKQILKGILTIHYKMNGFHGDIKPDNILLSGINDKDKQIIESYIKADFPSLYAKAKQDYIVYSKPNLKSPKKLDTEKKHKIRRIVHQKIMELISINEDKENNDENYIDSQYMCDDKYINNPLIKITDFGFFCHKSEQFNDSFGTRYYMAPEIVLMGDCTSKVDIWALGCMLFELLTGEILFDPHSGSRGNTDFYHLEMMINLCGEFYKKNLISTKRYKQYFKDGKLMNIKYENKDKSTYDKLKERLEKHNINNPKIIKLLESMLQLYPNHRPSAKELLESDWF